MKTIMKHKGKIIAFVAGGFFVGLGLFAKVKAMTPIGGTTDA